MRICFFVLLSSLALRGHCFEASAALETILGAIQNPNTTQGLAAMEALVSPAQSTTLGPIQYSSTKYAKFDMRVSWAQFSAESVSAVLSKLEKGIKAQLGPRVASENMHGAVSYIKSTSEEMANSTSGFAPPFGYYQQGALSFESGKEDNLGHYIMYSWMRADRKSCGDESVATYCYIMRLGTSTMNFRPAKPWQVVTTSWNKGFMKGKGSRQEIVYLPEEIDREAIKYLWEQLMLGPFLASATASLKLGLELQEQLKLEQAVELDGLPANDTSRDKELPQDIQDVLAYLHKETQEKFEQDDPDSVNELGGMLKQLRDYSLTKLRAKANWNIDLFSRCKERIGAILAEVRAYRERHNK